MTERVIELLTAENDNFFTKQNPDLSMCLVSHIHFITHQTFVSQLKVLSGGLVRSCLDIQEVPTSNAGSDCHFAITDWSSPLQHGTL